MSNSENNFSVSDGVVRFNEEANRFSTWVQGPIIHTKAAEKLGDWKKRLASIVKAKRDARWKSCHLHAVTLEFRFCPPNKEGQRDVDNYVKPVLDGLAAGLFLPDDKDPAHLERFDVYHGGVDDSSFRILLIHRLPDAETPEEEGVRLFVSSSGNAPPG